jgi:hypothetical protein
MPSAPGKLCNRNGCRGVVRQRVCSVCGPRPAIGTGWKGNGQQGTRQARGYDAAWYRLRAAVIEQRTREGGGVVVCEACRRPIVNEPIHADHRREFHGLDDPLRLDAQNVQLLHRSCHMSRTGARNRAGTGGGVS